jgi:hypothetical protein
MKPAVHHAMRTALVMLALSAPASAQLLHQSHDWNHGTTLNLFAGAGTDPAGTQPLLGTSHGWEITPSIGIEGSGYWFDRSGKSDAFAAALKLQAGVTAPHTVVPFVTAGIGLYRASFDAAAGNIPDFYRRRIAMHGDGPGIMSTFTDPSFVFGGGLNVFVTRHVAIRPDVETMIVVRDSASHVVTAVAVHLAYHFENPPSR